MTKQFDKHQYRTLALEARAINADDRSIDAALSSETPVARYFGTEILVHEEASVDMERAVDGLPLLWSHDHEQPIGRIENIRVDKDRVLRGRLRFSKNAKASEIWGDVSEGFLRDLSIGYRIDKYEIEEDEDIVRVTGWTPLEASVVTVPADSRVGMNRKHEGKKMSEQDKTESAAEPTATRQQDSTTESQLKLYRLDKEREQREGMRKEAERRSAVNDLIDQYERRLGENSLQALRSLAENSYEMTTDRVREEINKAILEGRIDPPHVAVDVSARQDEGRSFSDLPRFGAGEDKSDKFTRAMELSLTIQSGNKVTEEERREVMDTEWYSMSVADMARNYLRMMGERPKGEKHQVIGQAFKRSPSHGTSHFASVLENVANKAMVAGFMEADETWNRWVNIRSIPDFKTTSLLNMSLFTDLDTVYEGKEYEYGDMSDLKETIKLVTYGKLFGITRQALANDDLNALGMVPSAMGRAAARKIGDVVYEVLTTGTSTAMLQDSVNLFDAATHANYVTSGAAPSVTTVDAARVAMATQTDPQGKTIGLRMQHIIVPVALQTTADILATATYDPAGTAGTLPPNPFQGRIQVTADHRLDTFNSSGWFAAAATNQVVAAFLNGQQTPYMESKDGWSIDGIEYKVRIDCASTAEDFRGLYYNDGIT